jgi:hypothetical protein
MATKEEIKSNCELRISQMADENPEDGWFCIEACNWRFGWLSMKMFRAYIAQQVKAGTLLKRTGKDDPAGLGRTCYKRVEVCV